LRRNRRINELLDVFILVVKFFISACQCTLVYRDIVLVKNTGLI
jgi:hypothetical protein